MTSTYTVTRLICLAGFDETNVVSTCIYTNYSSEELKQHRTTILNHQIHRFTFYIISKLN